MISLPHPLTYVQKETTFSTNDDAIELAISGAPDLTIVWALSQSKARGRYGRKWLAPAGNLFWSTIVRLPDSKSLDGLAISTAMAVFDFVRAEIPEIVPVKIKWPNDILVNDKKVSGILIEKSGLENWAVVGVGINVLTLPDPESLSFPSTSLINEGSNISLGSAFEIFSAHFLSRINKWRTDGLNKISIQEYFNNLWRLNNIVTISLDKDRNINHTGSLIGVNDLGHLALDIDGEIKYFSAGDVFYT